VAEYVNISEKATRYEKVDSIARFNPLSYGNFL
jgi:hypothetical protein